MPDLNERLAKIAAGPPNKGPSMQECMAMASELLERRTSQPVAVRPWDTRPTGNDAMEPSEIDVHEGAWAAIIGTNGKPAGWIDTYELFAHQLYRHHILASPPSQGEPVTVRGLEWWENGPIATPADRYSFIAECQSIVGFYRIGCAADGWRVRFNGGVVAAELKSLEAAKAAAQADYEQRIRSALSPAPSLAVSDAAMLAGCRAISPGLFGRGFDPLPGDGPATKARMESDKLTVRKVLTAALGASHE